MTFSYNKLWIILIDRNMKKKDLIAAADISYTTVRKLENGENVYVEVLEKICRALNCSFDDIVELVPEKD